MKTPIDLLKNAFHRAIINAYPNCQLEEIPLDVVSSTNESFGHYQCNSAMKLTKLLKTPPRTIAEAIVKSLDKNTEQGTPFIARTEIAGPDLSISHWIRVSSKNMSTSSFHDNHLGVDISR